MSNHKVSERYAKSLYSLAKENGNVAAVLEDIKRTTLKSRDATFFVMETFVNDLPSVETIFPWWSA